MDKPNSTHGFLTSVWGPMMWSMLHMISLNYPVNPSYYQKQHYYQFVLSLTHVLPCRACRQNMIHTINDMGFSIEKHMENRDTFSQWIYEFSS